MIDVIEMIDNVSIMYLLSQYCVGFRQDAFRHAIVVQRMYYMHTVMEWSL
eukprot:m.30021 g.30021  ORF g.30021 m.30021 type:complete len:50 (-) comp13809_c0_seq1:228-377(-)